MEFGKLADISGVDFRLPEADLQSKAVLQQIPVSEEKPQIFVGPTGWAMPRWVGKWYPVGAKSKDFLKFYSRQFNTVEHNTTFYNNPDEHTVLRWKNDTEPDFKFCPKLPQTISRATDLGRKGDDLKFFLQNIALLEEKLGCCFLQLPPHFTADSLPILEAFFDVWDNSLPLAVEARHPSFFDGKLQSRAYFNSLQYYRKIAIITDVAGRRDILHQKLTLEKTMVRFVGNGLHSTDYERINQWAERLKRWCEWGLREVYFFVHEPDNLLAPELTLYLADQIKGSFDAEMRVPLPLQSGDNRSAQMSLF